MPFNVYVVVEKVQEGFHEVHVPRHKWMAMNIKYITKDDDVEKNSLVFVTSSEGIDAKKYKRCTLFLPDDRIVNLTSAPWKVEIYTLGNERGYLLRNLIADIAKEYIEAQSKNLPKVYLDGFVIEENHHDFILVNHKEYSDFAISVGKDNTDFDYIIKDIRSHSFFDESHWYMPLTESNIIEFIRMKI